MSLLYGLKFASDLSPVLRSNTFKQHSFEFMYQPLICFNIDIVINIAFNLSIYVLPFSSIYYNLRKVAINIISEFFLSQSLFVGRCILLYYRVSQQELMGLAVCGIRCTWLIFKTEPRIYPSETDLEVNILFVKFTHRLDQEIRWEREFHIRFWSMIYLQ